ncbi:MAG TPA: hypothetical protein DHU96_07665 [Actinobacteria bacterium]|nr:hypothetical protein [Actinomycetota bacterium]
MHVAGAVDDQHRRVAGVAEQGHLPAGAHRSHGGLRFRGAGALKFVLVATVGVAVCYMAGYALTQVLGISKVL